VSHPSGERQPLARASLCIDPPPFTDALPLGCLPLLSLTLLASLVAGFLFAFAVVVMPGIRELDDAAFIRAFQRVDGVIQRGDPLFGLVFVGSLVAVLGAPFLDGSALADVHRFVFLAASGVYIAGVILPTGMIHVPLNNALQRVQVDALDAEGLGAARHAFEPRWNRWNRIRTVLSPPRC